MLRYLYPIFLITVLLGLSVEISAQPNRKAIDRITSLDGLPHPTVNDVVQGHDGFLWIGTEEGLSRYDGYEFVTYYHDPEDSTTLSGDNIYSLEVDHEGNMWIGTIGNGLNRLNPRTGTITRFLHDPQDSTSISSNNAGNALHVDRNGDVWLGTAHGLNRFYPGEQNFKRFYHSEGNDSSLSNNVISSIFEDSNGTLWVGTGRLLGSGPSPGPGGLNRRISDTDSFVRYLHNPDDTLSLYDNRVVALFEDRDGLLWAGGSSSALQYFDPVADQFHRWYPSTKARRIFEQQGKISDAELSRRIITDIVQDIHGDLWIGSFFGGLMQFDKNAERLQFYQNDVFDSRSLADDRVIHMNIDRQDIVWVTTMSGLNKINPYQGAFKSIMPQEGGLHGGLVNGISIDKDNNVWLSVKDDLGKDAIARYNPTTEAIDYISVNELIGPQKITYPARYVYADRGGMIWSVQEEGLIRINPETGAYKNYHESPENPGGVKGRDVSQLVEDASGRLWVTTDVGIQFKDPGSDSFTLIEVVVPGLPDTDPKAKPPTMKIIQDVSNADFFWVSTYNGVFLLDQTTLEMDYFFPGFLIWDIYDDGKGNIWIGTLTDGVYALNKGTEEITRYGKKEGLSSDAIRSLSGDEQGRIWVGTADLLSMIDPVKGIVRNFGPLEGMNTVRFNALIAEKGPRGALYFGGDNGFLVFNPNAFTTNPHPPEIVYTDILVNDVPVSNPIDKATSPLELHHSENDIAITFAGIHFDRPNENRYMYILEGYDDDWKGPGSVRTANYTNLPPGRFVLKVKASNADGIWTPEESAIQFTITPPWWRTTWAYALFSLFAVGFLYGASRYQRAQQMKESENQARVREAQLKAEHAMEQNKILAEMDVVKSRFFANISHEFRTPLTLLLGPIRDALEGHYTPDEHRWQQQLGLMERNAHKLLQLINQLLDLSRIEAGRIDLHLRKRDIVASVRRIVASFSSLAERKSIRFDQELPAEPVYMYFDPEKIEIVLSNLLSNAFKFTEDKGQVSVYLAIDPEFVFITVRDSGRGIPEEDIPFVFDRFYQADNSMTRSYEGTGIGLSLSKELIELHEGSIEIESELDAGSIFTVRISRTLVPSEEDVDNFNVEEEQLHDSNEGVWYEGTKLKQEMASDPPDHAPLVLLVEDNEDVRAYLRMHLSEYFRIEEAIDGIEGLDKAMSSMPDLVISDVMMPRMGGFELCERIKSEEKIKHIPVLLLTARSEESDKLEGLESGADDYLMKPFNSRELVVRVENLITIRQMLKDKFTGVARIESLDIEVPAAEAVFIEKVRTVIEENMHKESFTVEYLASEVALSPRQLQRRMRATMNLSASGYIRSIRMQRAAQLLEQKWGNVSEVAHAIGFSSVPYFSKLFKQVYGVLPSQYGGS